MHQHHHPPSWKFKFYDAKLYRSFYVSDIVYIRFFRNLHHVLYFNFACNCSLKSSWEHWVLSSLFHSILATFFHHPHFHSLLYIDVHIMLTKKKQLWCTTNLSLCWGGKRKEKLSSFCTEKWRKKEMKSNVNSLSTCQLTLMQNLPFYSSFLIYLVIVSNVIKFPLALFLLSKVMRWDWNSSTPKSKCWQPKRHCEWNNSAIIDHFNILNATLPH
jgi:hypothetical protein